MLTAGQQIPVGLGFASVLPDFDFETYSESGCVLTNDLKWVSPLGKGKRKSLPIVGAASYAMHPSTEVLCMAYDLKQGAGDQLWIPDMPPPQDFLDHVARGGLLEAHNSMFEYLIWTYVCTVKYGWPAIPIEQLRCSASKARAFSYPGALGKVAKIVGAEQKDSVTGGKVIKRFSEPRAATKKDPVLRFHPKGDPMEPDLYNYCIQDIKAEASVSQACPDLSPEELEIWILDQKINARGIAIDKAAVNVLYDVYESAMDRANEEICRLTQGAVEKVSEVGATVAWLQGYGLDLDNLDKEAVEFGLSLPDLDETARRVLELRRATASAGAKKLQALKFRTCPDDRLRDAFNYYRAHTGRWSSEGLQLQNMIAGGPDMVQTTCCSTWVPVGLHENCPLCAISDPVPTTGTEWGLDPMSDFLDNAVKWRTFETLDLVYGPYLVSMIASSIRGLVVAGPGKELLCSDYTAIEAVGLAVLAGEQWRIELFATHGKIYEKTASDITGIPFEDILAHKEQTGSSHPSRKPFGKVPELASGYQGWIGAWKAFGADAFMDEQKIKESILAWRAASPAIVELWGGQWREVTPGSWTFEWDLHGLEGTAIKAVLDPGKWFTYRWIRYGVFGDILYCLLPSGRTIAYHEPRLERGADRRSGNECYKLSHMFNNTNPKKGKMGWIRVETYGGMLTENATQGWARDLLAHSLVSLEKAGYTVVGHVHDEVICEVDEGFGSVEEMERIMATLPSWAEGCPVKAAGGWRGKRYRKD